MQWPILLVINSFIRQSSKTFSYKIDFYRIDTPVFFCGWKMSSKIFVAKKVFRRKFVQIKKCIFSFSFLPLTTIKRRRCATETWEIFSVKPSCHIQFSQAFSKLLYIVWSIRGHSNNSRRGEGVTKVSREVFVGFKNSVCMEAKSHIWK